MAKPLPSAYTSGRVWAKARHAAARPLAPVREAARTHLSGHLPVVGAPSWSGGGVRQGEVTADQTCTLEPPTKAVGGSSTSKEWTLVTRPAL